MLPSPSDIHYFLEVASTLNMSRAAERLGVSQPSLTLAMKRLEDSVGTVILVRTKKGVTLTQAGKQLLSHGRQLLQSWDELKRRTRNSMNEVEGSFTFGCHPSVALYTLAEFIPSLLSEFKNLNINFKHDLSRKIAEGVISSQIDIGFVVNPIKHPDLVIHKLCNDDVTFWSLQGSSKNHDVLICDPDLVQTQSLLKSISKMKSAPTRIVTSGSLEVISDLVSSGSGIGILPTRVAQKARQPLVRVPGTPTFRDEICVLYRVENKSVRTIQELVRRIKAAVS